MTDTVVLVDENDQEIGVEEKIEAHKLGKLHRAFSVFVFRYNNNTTELLLQRRNPDKYHCGGLWTNTCCSHPRRGESIEKAGIRRLQEELGFQVPLHKVGSFVYKAAFDNGLTEHEFDHVLIGEYQENPIEPNPEEVCEIRWIGLEALNEEISQDPSRFTPWLPLALSVINLTQRFS